MRHHNGWGRKAVAESVGVVRFKWLLNHTSVVMVSCLELIAKIMLLPYFVLTEHEISTSLSFLG